MTKKTNTHGTDIAEGELPHSEVKKKLYEILADKTLSFGCKIKCLASNGHKDILGAYTIVNSWYKGEDIEHYTVLESNSGLVYREKIIKIIGHEPTLNDVLLKLGHHYFLFDGSLYCAKDYSWESVGSETTPQIPIFENIEYICEYANKSFDLQEEATHRKLLELLTQ